MLLCPICNKPYIEEFKPFCSQRCKQIDLLNWLNESYKIPVNEAIDINNEEKE